ncbi:carboxypeptidase M32 [Roseomonas alkaliterrae]|uniref:Metal-dependent carboxypeptidase n=1 Tax=Neoroseomonas alkaliterrae TaxID=1452450 RepID=A0A840YBN1_9PROT|nr:carboxypeptidase M32 [Neoroseomonas alkaliterrae]MBB5691284.1 carboxypeptidase Taq [Neoroseomonas alkaliterrae]MBR0676543.1 carboxypeptidase M32 [Neoroseomonas alkaliterrae]
MPNAAHARLKARFARIAALNEAAGMLHWDASAMMPPGGAASRGEQLAALAGLAHELLTAPVVAEDLAIARADGIWAETNLRLMARAHARATALPTELVEAAARANSACEKTWREAKARADFALVRPALAEVVRLQRETAQALGAALEMDPYDALMDGYQPGIAAADVEPVFAAYEAFLRDALPRAEAIQAARPEPVPLPGPFPVEVQRALCRRLSARIGLDYEHARLDESLHPFCGGTPEDVRITTFYDEQDVAKALLGVLHETGHALYERGLPKEWARQPVGEAAGMGAHESQSLIVEMQACRSDAFLGFLGRELREAFGGPAEPYEAGNLARLWRRVGRGFIRVDADEITYPAHVILRFRLERALIGGALDVADLPAAWNEGMRDMLGITPPDDAKGCLQDIHWHDGAFGYFPSYTLGAMAAAQLMKAARAAVPGLAEALAEGEMAPLLGWLRAHVHGKGSLLGFQDLLREATGKPLDPADFTEHLTARYLQA